MAAMLAACGSSSGSDPFCGNTGQVGSLTVTRASLPKENRLHFSFPARVTASSLANARGVAEAACALPPMTNKAVACPNDMGITYRLTFLTPAGRKLATVIADPTGCVNVTGLGAVRTVVRSPGFWRTLGQAMRLNHPGQMVFIPS
jgi:hypothetical protein